MRPDPSSPLPTLDAALHLVAQLGTLLPALGLILLFGVLVLILVEWR